MKNMYKKVTAGKKYDLKIATEHNEAMEISKVRAKDLPAIELEFINNNNVGCSLHYGMALYKLLHDMGIESYIAITREENPFTKQNTKHHVSVCYLWNGERRIADPVETVKGNGEFFDVPIEVFKRQKGTILLYDPYGEYGDKLFFEDFLAYPKETILDD